MGNVDEKSVRPGVSRRGFLGAGALAGVSLAYSGHGAEAAARAIPQQWDEEFDVVVVGSGFAGLAAAHEAHKAGASVVILEKMRTPGGNSIINGGVVAAAGSPLQRDAASRIRRNSCLPTC